MLSEVEFHNKVNDKTTYFDIGLNKKVRLKKPNLFWLIKLIGLDGVD